MNTLSANAFRQWLERYGKAWESGDADAVVGLFTRDARYEETPFDQPMVGHPAIHDYWRQGAGESQKDVRFTFQIVSLEQNIGVAHWQAFFVRIPSGNRVDLDGVLLAEFSADGTCSVFREWWHRRETGG